MSLLNMEGGCVGESGGCHATRLTVVSAEVLWVGGGVDGAAGSLGLSDGERERLH